MSEVIQLGLVPEVHGNTWGKVESVGEMLVAPRVSTLFGLPQLRLSARAPEACFRERKRNF